MYRVVRRFKIACLSWNFSFNFKLFDGSYDIDELGPHEHEKFDLKCAA